MQNSTNMRILELLRFLYERTDENHPATVSDIIAHPVSYTHLDVYKRQTLSSISVRSRMCSTSWSPRTSMWTSASCRPLRSGTIIPLSLIHI